MKRILSAAVLFVLLVLTIVALNKVDSQRGTNKAGATPLTTHATN